MVMEAQKKQMEDWIGIYDGEQEKARKRIEEATEEEFKKLEVCNTMYRKKSIIRAAFKHYSNFTCYSL